MPTSSSPAFSVIFQDEFLVVANKPAGLLAVPGRGEDKQDCLAARIQARFPDALVVHRLDMATSGLMVFARGAAMQRKLSQLFRDREVQKRYVAVVAGRLQREAGEIDLPLICDWPSRPKQKVDHAAGKPSLTRYRVLIRNVPVRDPAGSLQAEDGEETTRLELEPVTGRSHQLRVHLSAIGHPILGDALYGDANAAPRLLLHACSLGFAHPANGTALKFDSPPPF